MEYPTDNTYHHKGKHLSKENRSELQGILRTARRLGQKLSLRKLARMLSCSPSTIRNEKKRGAHPKTVNYGAARAQHDYEAKHRNSVTKSKRFIVSPFVEWVNKQVRYHKWSLDACTGLC